MVYKLAGAFCLLAAKLFCALQILYKSPLNLFTYNIILILANTTSSVIMYPVANLLKVKLVYVPLYILTYNNTEL